MLAEYQELMAGVSETRNLLKAELMNALNHWFVKQCPAYNYIGVIQNDKANNFCGAVTVDIWNSTKPTLSLV
jgi:hypothetical protein